MSRCQAENPETIQPELRNRNGSARGPRAGLGGSPKPSSHILYPISARKSLGDEIFGEPPKTARQRRALPVRLRRTRLLGIRVQMTLIERRYRRCGMVQFQTASGITPFFVPPLETGFQAVIESFKGLWQQKVWARFHHENLSSELTARSRGSPSWRSRRSFHPARDWPR